jgi:hypothetical protein
MFLELAKLVSLLLCILAIYALFHTAFLAPSMGIDQRLLESAKMLAMAAAAALLSGMIFRDYARQMGVAHVRVRATLPVRIFLWMSAGMLVLFAVCWYLENYFVAWKPAFPR